MREGGGPRPTWRHGQPPRRRQRFRSAARPAPAARRTGRARHGRRRADLRHRLGHVRAHLAGDPIEERLDRQHVLFSAGAAHPERHAVALRLPLADDGHVRDLRDLALADAANLALHLAAGPVFGQEDRLEVVADGGRALDRGRGRAGARGGRAAARARRTAMRCRGVTVRSRSAVTARSAPPTECRRSRGTRGRGCRSHRCRCSYPAP